ncbi:hypothetical protein O7632_22760 [Solwaraspora sp. WMMD406]|uniref:hypothetical protein n=1 Tax=Solwaraspora sp. WMMD406 TaxID=3016095 RepID=UPI002416C9D6|nr:hypothetical protein [Solwaraspora sp. WMMD406]MDG4766898.1 hypothetical protein [Solwaraspora sp. WMMD406]
MATSRPKPSDRQDEPEEAKRTPDDAEYLVEPFQHIIVVKGVSYPNKHHTQRDKPCTPRNAPASAANPLAHHRHTILTVT